MSDRRRAWLLRHGRNQVVRIPVEFERPSDEAIMHRDGDRPAIEPIRRRGLIAPLELIAPLAEDCPGIDDLVPAPDHVS